MTSTITIKGKFNPVYTEIKQEPEAGEVSVRFAEVVPSSFFILHLHGLREVYCGGGLYDALGGIGTVVNSKAAAFMPGDAVLVAGMDHVGQVAAVPAERVIKIEFASMLYASAFAYTAVEVIMRTLKSTGVLQQDDKATALVVGTDANAALSIAALGRYGIASDQFTGTSFSKGMIGELRKYPVVFDCRLKPTIEPVASLITDGGVYVPVALGGKEWVMSREQQTDVVTIVPAIGDATYMAALQEVIRTAMKPPLFQGGAGMRRMMSTCKFTNLFPGILNDKRFCVIQVQ